MSSLSSVASETVEAEASRYEVIGQNTTEEVHADAQS